MKASVIKMASLVILGIISISFLKAENPTPEKIDKLLKKEISYPEFAKEQKLEGMVLVNFTVTAEGNIRINLTNESDVSLKDYVVKRLQNLWIKPSGESTEKSYNVKFEFKSEK